MITIVGNGAIAETQAEAEAYDPELWPDPCKILCLDTSVTLLFDDGELGVLPNAVSELEEKLNVKIHVGPDPPEDPEVRTIWFPTDE